MAASRKRVVLEQTLTKFGALLAFKFALHPEETISDRMSLSRSYTLIAPLYDAVVAGVTNAPRRRSLDRLVSGARVLLSGIGTGLDLAHLKSGNTYVGFDL